MRAKLAQMSEKAVSFGESVRSNRERLGWTQRQLSWRVACAEITLRKIESGKRKASARLVQLLADALRLDPVERERHIQEALTRNVRQIATPAVAAHEDAAPEAARYQADSAQLLAMALELDTMHPVAAKDQLVISLTQQLPRLRACLRWLLAHNSDVALALTGALREFWIKSALFGEGRGWLEQALMLDASPNAARASALLAAGSLAFFQSDYVHAERRFAEYDLLVARLPDVARSAGPGMALAIKGMIAVNGHWDIAKALACFDRGIAHFEALNDPARVANMQCGKALVLAYAPSGEPGQNDAPRQAIALARQAEATFERFGFASSQAYAWTAAASAHEVLGEFATAEKLIVRALEIRRAGTDLRDLAWALAQLAYVRNALGRSDQVQALLEEALQRFHDMGEKKAVCHVLQMRARMERAANKPESTRRLLAASIQTGVELHDVIVISKGLLDAAALALDESNLPHAARLLAIADVIAPADNAALRTDYARLLAAVEATPSVDILQAARDAAQRIKLEDIAEMVLSLDHAPQQ